MKRITMIGLAGLMAAITTQASLIVSIEEDGNDVTFTCSGTANTTGLTALVSNPSQPQTAIGPSDGTLLSCNPGYDVFSLNGASPVFGTSLILTTADVVSGDSFGFDQSGGVGAFFVPFSYISGDAISGSMRMENESFASLGITQGYSQSVTFNAGANLDSITVQAIPEPATLTFVGLFGVGIFTVRRFFMI